MIAVHYRAKDVNQNHHVPEKEAEELGFVVRKVVEWDVMHRMVDRAVAATVFCC